VLEPLPPASGDASPADAAARLRDLVMRYNGVRDRLLAEVERSTALAREHLASYRLQAVAAEGHLPLLPPPDIPVPDVRLADLAHRFPGLPTVPSDFARVLLPAPAERCRRGRLLGALRALFKRR
jgi:hypothetical protein